MRLSYFPCLAKGEEKTQNLIYIIKVLNLIYPTLNNFFFFSFFWLSQERKKPRRLNSLFLEWKISCKHDTIIKAVTSTVGEEVGWSSQGALYVDGDG